MHALLSQMLSVGAKESESDTHSSFVKLQRQLFKHMYVQMLLAALFLALQWSREPLLLLLQYKSRKGNTEVFVSATVQRFTELVREKQHPVLDRLHELASHLLTHRQSARFTARQALEEVKMLASMKISSM